MKTTRKVWRSGLNNIVVTMPKVIRDALNIEIGDLVEVDIKKVELPDKSAVTSKKTYKVS